MPSKNYSAYLKLNTNKYPQGYYLVMINGQVEGSGPPGELKKMVAEVRKKFPKKIPSIAKVSPKGMMVL